MAVRLLRPHADDDLELRIGELLQQAGDHYNLVVGFQNVIGDIDDGYVDLLVLSNRPEIQHSQLILAYYAYQRGVPFIYVNPERIAAACNYLDADFRAAAVVADWYYDLGDITDIVGLVTGMCFEHGFEMLEDYIS